MTPLQVAIAAGLLLGLGLAVSLTYFSSATPALREALDRLTTARPVAPIGGARDQLGAWGARSLPRVPRLAPDDRDLAILRLSSARFWGDKVVRALVGLAAVPVLAVIWVLAGLVPVVPVMLSLALACLLFITPDIAVRRRAAAARVEFVRAVGALLDLVALERIGGAGPGQALDTAAGVGDTWPFERIREELERARLAGTTPWTQLRRLGVDLHIPELVELADILRLSADEGAAVYDTLRARAATLRNALLQTEQARANATSERLTFPVVLLAVTFLAIVLIAQGMRLIEIQQ